MGAEVVASGRHGDDRQPGASGAGCEEPERRALYQRLLVLLRRYGARSERLTDVLATAQQMHPTDLRALLVVVDSQSAGGWATPKVLSEALSLTSGAVTGVVDRLVRSGHVERQADSFDRRQVKITCRPQALELLDRVLQPLALRLGAVMDGYSREELVTVERFVSDAITALALHAQATSCPVRDN